MDDEEIMDRISEVTDEWLIGETDTSEAVEMIIELVRARG